MTSRGPDPRADLNKNATVCEGEEGRSLVALFGATGRNEVWPVGRAGEARRGGITHPHHQGISTVGWCGGGIGGWLDHGPAIARQHSGLQLDPHLLTPADLRGARRFEAGAQN
jgi:hypothetical protein